MTQPHPLGPLPTDRLVTTVDQRSIRAPVCAIFDLAADVEAWPRRLRHYRYVRFVDRRADGGGTVEMSANRSFGVASWPTWWTSLMSVARPTEAGLVRPSIRFRHIRGITAGMEVEWTFEPMTVTRGEERTLVRIVHVWNGPRWPVIGALAARGVIGPVFVHAIATRTLAGLARAAEGVATDDSEIEVSSG